MAFSPSPAPGPQDGNPGEAGEQALEPVGVTTPESTNVVLELTVSGQFSTQLAFASAVFQVLLMSLLGVSLRSLYLADLSGNDLECIHSGRLCNL